MSDQSPIDVLTEALLDCADVFDRAGDVEMLATIAQALKDAGYKPLHDDRRAS